MALTLSLVAGGLVVTPAGASHGGPGECATAMPASELSAGMVGTGYTVSQGELPETFEAEVLGVLPDGVGPGRDMIIVEARSPAIDKAGGIWFGMSGSPVYVNGELIGALAFGLAWGPSRVAGLTPAEDLIDLVNRPEATPPTTPRKVELPARMVRTIARASGTSVEDTGDEMRMLKSPLSVSGLGAHRLGVVNKAVRREGLALLPYAGSSASAAPAAATETPEPGGNFAAVASYGDVSFAGIGTTSYVCDGKAVAFGHSFYGLPIGDVTLGANLANAITIVDDPSFGPYKLATVAETLGALDQDRFAGVRALLGATFPLVPLTSTVTLENGLNSEEGATEVVDADFVPFAAFVHMLSNIDFTRDEIGAGTSSLSWTINGLRADGSPWSVARSNMYASDWDIAIESVFELEEQLWRLLTNRFEDITFSDIDVDATVGEDVRRYELTDLQVRMRGDYVERRRIRVRPGRLLHLRALLTPEGTDPPKVVDFQIRIPARARTDHSVSVGGGSNVGFGVMVDELSCFSGSCRLGNHQPKADSFEELISILSGAPRNNDLVAQLRGVRGKRKATIVMTQDEVVLGEKVIHLRIRGRGGLVR